MADIDITMLGDRELEDLAEDIKSELARRREEKRARAVEEIQRIAESVGVSPEELLGITRRERKRTRAGGGRKYKYQNPTRPRQKWSGEGKKPDWFADLEKQGRTQEAVIESAAA